ncbi:unnamed protein product, partial [Polarella glacialis]
ADAWPRQVQMQADEQEQALWPEPLEPSLPVLTKGSRDVCEDAKPSQVTIYFAVVAPRPGAHGEIIALLQMSIVAPLVRRKILLEFRVLAATPPDFVAESSTLVVFELVVPCPWPITYCDVEDWQRKLGDGVRLVVASGNAPRQEDTWDAKRAHSVLARALVMPPTLQVSEHPARSSGGGSWAGSCAGDRPFKGDSSAEFEGMTPRRRRLAKSFLGSAEAFGATSSQTAPTLSASSTQAQPYASTDLKWPWLSVVDEESGQRIRLSGARMTMMSTALAMDLYHHLPVSIRWRTAWRLVYSPRLHGVSLQTFHRRMREEGPSLILLQDHCGIVFGGFASEPWRLTDRYYGSGESFVFRFRRAMPKPVVPLVQQIQHLVKSALKSSEENGSNADSAKVATQNAIQQAVELLKDWRPKVQAEHERAEREVLAAGLIRSPTEALDALLGQSGLGEGAPTELAESQQQGWTERPAPTPGIDDAGGGGCAQDSVVAEDGDFGLQVYPGGCGENQFFLFSDATCLAMGGGAGVALYLEKDLLHGMSEACATFGSEVLASSQNFVISDLECWAFDDPTEVGDC